MYKKSQQSSHFAMFVHNCGTGFGPVGRGWAGSEQHKSCPTTRESSSEDSAQQGRKA